jgi:hypothetical protein
MILSLVPEVHVATNLFSFQDDPLKVYVGLTHLSCIRPVEGSSV